MSVLKESIKQIIFPVFVFACFFSVAFPSHASEDEKKKKENKDALNKESGQDEILAKQHFKKGVEFFGNEKYEEALEEFQKSYQLKPHWAVKYNLGLCHLKLGNDPEAAMELTMYIETGGKNIKNAVRKEVESILSDLMVELGSIVFFGDLKGLTIFVNGKKTTGPTEKGELFVRPGTVEIEVQREGNTILKKSLSIEKGEITEIDLPKTPPAEATPVTKIKPEESSKSPAEKKIENEKPVMQEPLKSSEQTKYHEKVKKGLVPMMWVWIGLGITGGTLIAGSTLGILAVKERDNMQTDEENYRLHPSEEILSSRDEHYEKGNAYAISSTALLATSAAAGIATIILYVLTNIEKKKEGEPERTDTSGKKTSHFFPLLQGNGAIFIMDF